jgi:hypothetical protein
MNTEKPKSFFQTLVENAKERLKKFKFANPIEASAAALAVVEQEARQLRAQHLRGSMMKNHIRRQRAKTRMERRSRAINFAKARG